jgi:hypothetical protein
MSISAISGLSDLGTAHPGRPSPSGSAPPPAETPTPVPSIPPASGGADQGQQLSSEMLAVLINQQGTLTGSSSFAD